MSLERIEITPSRGKCTFEYVETIFGERVTWGDLNIPKIFLGEYIKKNPYPKEETFYEIDSLYEDFVEGEGLATITVGSEEGKEWVDNLVDYIWNNFEAWEKGE